MTDTSGLDGLASHSAETRVAGHSALGATAEWPFIGRDDEMRLLRRLVAGGEGPGVVVAGPPGVGKTRLAVECLREAEQAGLAIFRTTATRSAATLPFGAMAPLLPVGGRSLGAVDDLADLLRRTATELIEQAGDRRVVLSVDNAHLLDDASATLVHQLAATGAACVLVTALTGLRAPDPVQALWRDRLVERIELGHLPEEKVAELLTAVAGGPLDPAALAELTTRAQGNFLILRELVSAALEDGTLAEEGGVWRLRGRLSPSNRLVELVETRLENQGLAERALLELVAFGEPLGQAELSTLAEPALVETLERQGLLLSSVNGRRLEVRFAHPIYSEVIRDRIPAVRAQAIARALAETVELAGARRRDDALRVASFRLVGGGGEAGVMLAGAATARWRYDFPLAESLARAALDAGAGFDASLLAAELAGLRGRTEQAERELVALAVEALRSGDDTQRGRVALARIDLTSWTRPDELHILDAAAATISDPEWSDRLAARRLQALLHARGPREVVAAAGPVLTRVRGPALVYASIPAATGLSRMGRLDEALATATQGRAAHVALSEPLAWYPWWHGFTRCCALNFAGRFGEAETEAEAHYQQALEERSTEAQAMFALFPALAVAERGCVEAASRGAATAIALGQDLGRPLAVCLGYIYQALALAIAGRGPESAAALAASDSLAVPAPRQVDVDRAWARAWTAAATGDLQEARNRLEQAADIADEIGDLVGEASALHGLARLGRAREVCQRLAAVAEQIDGELVQVRLGHTEALARADVTGLETASRAFEAMGAELLAAEAAADATVAHRQAGDRRATIASEYRTGVLLQRCRGAVTPALQPLELRARLTAAERETALLAATGCSNKQIAAELHLSVRTVENRLHRVYEKLGVSGRAALAGALDNGHR